MRKIAFYPEAYNEFMAFSHDKKLFSKIHTLIKDIARNPQNSLGKPERLKGDLSGCYSRRIDAKNRIVYRFDNEKCEILQVGSHYKDK